MNSRTLPGRNTLAGFTLIELMVTIAIVAILATVAVSAYTSQVQKSRRTEARTALLDLASREERYSSTNNTYTNSPANLGYTGAAFPITVGSGYYQVSVCVASGVTAPNCAGANATGSVFLLTATAIGTQAKDAACATLTVDSTGTQGGTNTTCWK